MKDFLTKLFGNSRAPWEEIPEGWEFDQPQKAALEALRLYGIRMRGYDDGKDGQRMTFSIPMELRAEEYVEIGYLIAQLARDDFPKRYSRFGFATDAWSGIADPTVRFLDMAPGGYRVRVMLRPQSKADAEQSA